MKDEATLLGNEAGRVLYFHEVACGRGGGMWDNDASSGHLRQTHISRGIFHLSGRNGEFPTPPHVNTAIQSFSEAPDNQNAGSERTKSRAHQPGTNFSIDFWEHRYGSLLHRRTTRSVKAHRGRSTRGRVAGMITSNCTVIFLSKHLQPS